MKFLLSVAASGLCLAIWTGNAEAGSLTVFGYELSASIGPQVAPSYEGGKRYAVFANGNPNMTVPGAFDEFSAADESFSVAIHHSKTLAFGPVANLIENRGNDDELAGLRNIGLAFESGGFVNWWPTEGLRARVEVRKGLVAHSGLLIDASLDAVTHPGRWMLSAGPRLGFADKSFTSTYFGVTAAEAAASPYIRSPYNPNGGPRYGGLQATMEYKLRPGLRLTFNASYHRILGDAAASPLVRQLGTPDQFGMGTGVRFVIGH